LASNQIIHVRILDNIVEIMSERLSATNLQNDKLRKQIMQLEQEDEDDYEQTGSAGGDMASEFDQYPGDEDQ
jgi:hypothetical protein